MRLVTSREPKKEVTVQLSEAQAGQGVLDVIEAISSVSDILNCTSDKRKVKVAHG